MTLESILNLLEEKNNKELKEYLNSLTSKELLLFLKDAISQKPDDPINMIMVLYKLL
jgi:hypothetical protein